MASMLFVLSIVAPLVLLGFNLSRGAVGLARSRKESSDLSVRRPRPLESPWPVRARRLSPAVDPMRSPSPLAALRRRMDARRSARAGHRVHRRTRTHAAP